MHGKGGDCPESNSERDHLAHRETGTGGNEPRERHRYGGKRKRARCRGASQTIAVEI